MELSLCLETVFLLSFEHNVKCKKYLFTYLKRTLGVFYVILFIFFSLFLPYWLLSFPHPPLSIQLLPRKGFYFTSRRLSSCVIWWLKIVKRLSLNRIWGVIKKGGVCLCMRHGESLVISFLLFWYLCNSLSFISVYWFGCWTFILWI